MGNSVIMFTKTYVTSCADGSKHDTLMVAPLSVLIEYRKMGIGSVLMKEGFRNCRKEWIILQFLLLGDPDYYRGSIKSLTQLYPYHEKFSGRISYDF